LDDKKAVRCDGVHHPIFEYSHGHRWTVEKTVVNPLLDASRFSGAIINDWDTPIAKSG
jgi:hypothetical protein